jgi:hypothetical protein
MRVQLFALRDHRYLLMPWFLIIAASLTQLYHTQEVAQARSWSSLGSLFCPPSPYCVGVMRTSSM